MADERKTQAQIEEELARLRQEVAGLRGALAAPQASRPVEGMPADHDLLFETLTEALMVVRIRDGLILRTNPCCRQLLGMGQDAPAGKTLYDFLPEAARARAEAEIREAAAGNRLVPQHEATYHRPDGTPVAVRISGAVLGDGPDAAALLCLQDITESRQARRLLREAEQRYRLVVESAADPIFMFDREGRFAAANPAVAGALHARPEDLIGKRIRDLFPPEIAERQWRHVTKVFETGEPLFSEEDESRTAEGPRWYNTSLTPVRNERGEVEYVIGIARDVTDRKRAEAALRESEARYRAVVDSQTELVCRFAPDCKITFVNETLCRSTGLGREELVGASFLPYVPEPDRADLAARLAALSPQCPVLEDEHVILTRTGESRWYHWVNRGVFDEQGRLVEIQAAGRDVTEQRRVEAALGQSEANYRAIFNAANDFIWIYDPATRAILDANESMYRAFGYSREEVRGLTIRDLTAREGELPAERVAERHERFIRDGRLGPFEWLAKDRHGRKFWCEVNLKIVNLQGQDRALAVVRDISDRKKAEEALRGGEAELQAVQDAMGDALVIVDIETQRLVRLNPAAYRMFGYAPGELEGLLVHALHPPEDVEFTNSQFRNRLQGIFNPVSEIRCLRKDGTVFTADMTTAPIPIRGRRCTMGVFRDITERKKAEEALRQSEENYRLLFESNISGIAIVVGGRIVRANKALCDIHRFSPEAITGMSPLDFVDPQYREELRGKQEALDRGEITTYGGNFRIVRGDGTAGWVEVRAGPMTWGGKRARLAIVQDVTQRVHLENELREVQKMEAVGQLAGGIAHDFNNLLTGILCSAQLLKTGPGVPKAVYETADVIEKAARRAAELTSQLLGFARRGKHQDVPVDLGATIRTVIRLMAGAVDPRITVEVALPREPVLTRGDPSQMEQVVLNLAMNARDAMSGEGRLTFAAEPIELDAAACAGRAGARPGRYVVLCVSDTGCGIHEEIRGRIFEPFFTTKPIGKGTGMGLAMVYGIARNHGGWVEVDSAVGKGTTFRVYLPALAGKAPQGAGKGEGGAAKKGRRPRAAAGRRAAAKRPGRTPAPCILVVDDNEMVRKSLTRMLASLGYSVVTAADGREAVATYGMFGSGVDVVIIDMAMPGLDGRECFQALHRLNPRVKAILCTGGPADEATRDLVGKGLVDFIQKPYQAGQLAAAIAKALATRRGEAPGAASGPEA